MDTTPLVIHAVYVAAGAAAGLLSGLLGIGGGLVMVPALVVCFTLAGLPAQAVPSLALGTSLSVIGFVSLLTTRENLRVGHLAPLRPARLLPLAACLAAGVVAGAVVSTRLPLRSMLLLLGLFQIGIGARMWWSSSRPARARTIELPPDLAQERLRLPRAGSVLFASGVVSAIGGIAGATLMTPYFARVGMAYPQAAALSTCFGCVVGAAGFVSYGVLAQPAEALPMSVGYVSLPAFASMAAGSVCLVRCGARLSTRVSKSMLTRGFCCFLFASGLKLLLPLGSTGGVTT